MNQISKQPRSLALWLSSRGFGYCLMEGSNTLVDYGNTVINGDKNNRVVAHIEKMIVRNQPDVLVLSDVNAKGTHRTVRIKKLHAAIVALAKGRRIKVVKISGKQVRQLLLGDETGTKQEIAEHLAKQFPDELSSRLPPKRKAWKSEDARMDIFEAVGLALTHRGLR